MLKGKEVKGEAALKMSLRTGAELHTERKPRTGTKANATKLEADTESLHNARVSHSFKVALQRARQAKKLTQKGLGALVNEKGAVVNSYEAGTAVPDGPLIAKMERALGCKLPRK